VEASGCWALVAVQLQSRDLQCIRVHPSFHRTATLPAQAIQQAWAVMAALRKTLVLWPALFDRPHLPHASRAPLRNL
jgi:hypothetical protein